MTQQWVIETDALTKAYGSLRAVDGISLRVAPGRITGFLGRNGAGKSSTVKMLLGMIAPSSGTGRVLGHTIDDPRESVTMRRSVAYVGEDKGLYAYMTVEEMIRFTRAFYPDWCRDTEAKLLRDYELPVTRNVKALSKGMRTKLALLLAFSRRPQLLILDEPTEGLDPVSIEELLQSLIRVSADGTSVFFSSHQLNDVERVAEDVVMIDRGRLALQTSMDEVRSDFRIVTLGFTVPPADTMLQLPGVDRVRASGRQVTLLVSRNADEIIRSAQSLGAISVESSTVSLREIFLDRVGVG